MNNLDDRFTHVLKDVNSIPLFMDSFFGFLYRNTDFYNENRETADFTNAEILVRDTFRKYQTLERQKHAVNDVSIATTDSEIPVAETVEVECGDSDMGDSRKESASKEEDEDPNLKTEQQRYQNEADSYNGAIRENYCWSQNIKEVDVKVKVAKEVVKGKQVTVDIKSTYLKVTALIAGEWKVLVDDELCWPIAKESSVWTLVPGEHVHVSLEKCQERWWNALTKSEPCINIRHIDASRPMEELPDDEQAKIQELMFDQEQKRQGKPTIEQIKREEVLREAWDKDGSPFKGMPFDPSVVNFISSTDPQAGAFQKK